MTREEALEILKGMKYPYNYKKNKMIISNVNEETEALNMAISALEQEQDMTIAYLMGKYEDKEPCEDAISREAVSDYLKANVDDFPDYHEAIEKVLQMPSVNATQHTSNATKDVEQRTNTLGDAISREDVLAEITRFSTEEGASVECQQLYCDVNNMPSVTPSRPTGHWKKITDSGKVLSYQCTCGCAYRNKFNYCPNCSADMKGEQK